jgi:RNA polymerase sigma-70 factor (ECF subfamily)
MSEMAHSLPLNARPPAGRHDFGAAAEPYRRELLAQEEAGPEAHFSVRESVTLAFVAALQWLPPRQRAVLILRDVLDWKASEAAELLGLTAPAVNSALHRARTTLSKHYQAPGAAALPTPDDPTLRAQLERYIRAWEHADINALLGLLKADATLSMPPTPSWYRGREAIGALLASMAFSPESRGRYRVLPVRANGLPGLAMYFRGTTGGFEAFGIQVLQFEGPWVAANVTFMTPALVPLFGLPTRLPAEAP